MGVQGKKIPVHDLRVGMFVSDLDRPWHETPFPIQGFYIRSQDEIRALISYCRAVFVDVSERRTPTEADTGVPAFGAKGRQDTEKSLKLPPVHIRNPHRYETGTSIQREIRHAEKVFADIQAALGKVYVQAAAGESLDLAIAQQAAESMVQSIIRNPDALIWLSRVRRRDQYTYRHSVNTAVWALVFGRQLGLQPDVLRQLGIGALLCQLGKAKLPRRMLKSETELTSDDLSIYRSYADIGAQMLETAGVTQGVVNIVRCHRERHNGTGFAQGITGEKIPLLAKMAGLAAHYESMIEPRADLRPLTPAQAVARLYDSRNIEFQEDLVEQFIQAVGVYPTGTFVALSDNQVGVVLTHRPDRRLWPKIMIVADQERNPLEQGRLIDLAEYNEGRTHQESLQIASSLPSGLAEVNPAFYDALETRSWRQRLSGFRSRGSLRPVAPDSAGQPRSL